jgi:hypothetical protein
MDQAIELHQRADALLQKRISLGEFQEWLTPLCWELPNSADRDLLVASRRILGKLAEHSRGARSFESFLLELENAINGDRLL